MIKLFYLKFIAVCPVMSMKVTMPTKQGVKTPCEIMCIKNQKFFLI